MQFSLRTVDLDGSPAYKALSYCWGNPAELNGLDERYSSRNLHPILLNLLEALKVFASSERDRRFKPFHKTELIRASEKGRLSDVIRYLGLGYNVQARDGFGETPLHYAAENGHLAVVEALLRHGADCEAVDGTGRTPLACCVQQRRGQHEEVYRVLTAPRDGVLGAKQRQAPRFNFFTDEI
jgi:hypothetical protein